MVGTFLLAAAHISLRLGENKFLTVDEFITDIVKIRNQYVRIVILTGKITL